MTHCLAILACLAGFACLCAAMTRHQKEFVRRSLSKAAAGRLRAAGGGLLLLALLTDMAGFGAGSGVVSWCGHLTLGAVLALVWLNHARARTTG